MNSDIVLQGEIEPNYARAQAARKADFGFSLHIMRYEVTRYCFNIYRFITCILISPAQIASMVFS
jgi:hypothetical protein